MNDAETISVRDLGDNTTASVVSNQQSQEPRLVGYARVSTDDQDLSLQIDALTQQGIPKTAIYMDKLSGFRDG
jgi:predicted site-specific integrase-resolvase